MGVQALLWILAWKQPLSTREWAAVSRLPIPVVAAVRGELVQRGFLQKGRRPSLTPEGNHLLREMFGNSCDLDSRCPLCEGSGLVIPAGLAPILEEFRRICSERPACDVRLDQSHGTPETGIRRSLLMVEKGLVLGRRVAFLGDDDLVCLALGLVLRAMGGDANRQPFLVLDIDERFVSFIRNHGANLGIRIDARRYDARSPLPDDLVGSCQTVLTDPPYTHNGIKLFAFRAAQLLGPEGGDLFLSYAEPAPDELLRLEEQLNRQGWVTVDLWPRFNRYEGSAVHAHQSTLRHLRCAARLPREKEADLCYSSLYTGDVRSPGGRYYCVLCESPVDVGPDQEYPTIADLKRSGCPECGGGSR